MIDFLNDKDYDRQKLPNELEALKDIIEGLVYHFHQEIERKTQELFAQITALQAENAQLRQQNVQLQAQVENLQGQITLLKQEKFGKKSEKRGSQSYSATLQKRLKKPGKKHPGRQVLPEHLERVRVEYDLSEEEKRCPLCQEAMDKIQEITTEQLDLVPAQLQVKQHVRFHYACRKCYGSIKRAQLPAQPIDKGLPTSRLLSHMMISKFMDHMPLYRQERWFSRQGCSISRSTMWGWEEKAAYELAPIVICLKQELLARDHLFSDDTPMPMIEKGLGKTKTGRFWTYLCAPTPTQPAITVYESTSDRKGEHPQNFLKGFKGYLQADGYGGYDRLFTNNHANSNNTDNSLSDDANNVIAAAASDSGGKGESKKDKNKASITEVGCLGGHVRRKFIEILKIDPDSIAKEPVGMIDALYEVEHQAKEAEYDYDRKKWLRKKKSKPILKKLYKWLRSHQPLVTPKSSLGQAIGYSLNNWRAFAIFLKDGRLEIDNNRSERAIKPIVIGRKNYLFMASPRGGWAAAIIYSLIETCLRNGVEPYHYLADVLERISTHPHKRIKELLPYNWQPSHLLLHQQTA